jgi:hypothetical protein
MDLSENGRGSYDANKPEELAGLGTASINVASSSLARELFIRLDTAYRCSTWFAAGLSNSMPALPESQGSN